MVINHLLWNDNFNRNINSILSTKITKIHFTFLSVLFGCRELHGSRNDISDGKSNWAAILELVIIFNAAVVADITLLCNLVLDANLFIQTHVVGKALVFALVRHENAVIVANVTVGFVFVIAILIWIHANVVGRAFERFLILHGDIWIVANITSSGLLVLHGGLGVKAPILPAEPCLLDSVKIAHMFILVIIFDRRVVADGTALGKLVFPFLLFVETEGVLWWLTVAPFLAHQDGRVVARTGAVPLITPLCLCLVETCVIIAADDFFLLAHQDVFTVAEVGQGASNVQSCLGLDGNVVAIAGGINALELTTTAISVVRRAKTAVTNKRVGQ